MGLVADLVTAKTGTGIVGTTIDVALSLGGLTPKVLWVYMVGRTDTINAVGVRDVCFSYGFALDASNRRVICAQIDNAAATSNTDRGFRDDCVLLEITTGSVTAGRLDINSVGANTVQFIVDAVFAQDYTFVVAAMAGTDITSAVIADWAMTTSAAPVDQDLNTIGFTPKYFEPIGVGLTTAFEVLGTVADIIMGRATTSPVANQVLAILSLNGQATMDSCSYANDVECVAVNLNTSSIITRAAVSAGISGGVRISLTESGASATRFSALCLDGTFQVSLGNCAAQNDTSTRVSNTTGFVPVLTHLWSACKAESTVDTPQANAEASIGSFLGLGQGTDKAVGFVDPDNVPDSTTASAMRFADSYVNISTAAAIEGSGGGNSGEVLPTTGWEWIMTTADASGAFVMFASFGAAVPVTPLGVAAMGSGRSFFGRAIAREFAA